MPTKRTSRRACTRGHACSSMCAKGMRQTLTSTAAHSIERESSPMVAPTAWPRELARSCVLAEVVPTTATSSKRATRMAMHSICQLASQNYSYLTTCKIICGQVNCAHWRLHLCITVCLPAQQTVSWPPGAESHGQELLYWYLSLLCIRAHGGITAALWWSLPTQVKTIKYKDQPGCLCCLHFCRGPQSLEADRWRHNNGHHHHHHHHHHHRGMWRRVAVSRRPAVRELPLGCQRHERLSPLCRRVEQP